MQAVQEGRHRLRDGAAALDVPLLGGVDGRVMRGQAKIPHKKSSFRDDVAGPSGGGGQAAAGSASEVWAAGVPNASWKALTSGSISWT